MERFICGISVTQLLWAPWNISFTRNLGVPLSANMLSMAPTCGHDHSLLRFLSTSGAFNIRTALRRIHEEDLRQRSRCCHTMLLPDASRCFQMLPDASLPQDVRLWFFLCQTVDPEGAARCSTLQRCDGIRRDTTRWDCTRCHTLPMCDAMRCDVRQTRTWRRKLNVMQCLTVCSAGPRGTTEWLMLLVFFVHFSMRF